MIKKELEQRYNTLSNDITELEKIESMLKHKKITQDTQFDNLNKGISSYDLKKDVSPYTESDKKAEYHLSLAKGHIRRGEGILSKNMDFGSDTYGIALKEIEYAKKEIEKHKNPEEFKKAKEEIANFAEALARKIKMDVEKKDTEYSLKKDLKEEDKKDLATYEKCRAKSLKVAEDAVEYAKKLIKD